MKRHLIPAMLVVLALAACARADRQYAPKPYANPLDDGRLPTALEMRQLPGSSIGRGSQQFERVWLADPTSRYPHAVFGTMLNAESLLAVTRFGETYQVTLPPERVFEDIAPRVIDLDRDALEEILVVESDRDQGASLAVYGTPIGTKQLVKLGATPFIGRTQRWLHPLGAGDFDGDGWLDIALVETPHIGGSLVLYRYRRGRLSEFARYFGVSTHEIGSRELDTARIVRGHLRDHLLVPDQSWHKLQLLTWRPTGIHRVREWRLPARLRRIDPPLGAQVAVLLADGQMLRLDLPELE